MRRHAFDRSKQRSSHGQAKLAGVLGFLGAVALPIALWHHAIGQLVASFHPSAYYLLTGWTAFGLMLLGLILFVPVVYSIGLSSHSPYYPRRRNAYAGWGITLYLLGVALASQVAAITHGLAPH